MSDFKRPGSMSDADRARVGAAHRRTPPRYPVEAEEVTPPPSPVPPTLDEVARAVNQIALSLHRGRHDAERIEGFGAKLDTLLVQQAQQGALQTEFIMPALKSTMGSVDLLLSHYEANKIRQAQFYDREWPAAAKKIDDLGDRLSRVERAVERGTEQHESLADRVEDVERRSHTASGRLTAIETNAVVETRVQQALTTRQKFSVGGIAGVIGTLAGLLSKWLG